MFAGYVLGCLAAQTPSGDLQVCVVAPFLVLCVENTPNGSASTARARGLERCTPCRDVPAFREKYPWSRYIYLGFRCSLAFWSIVVGHLLGGTWPLPRSSTVPAVSVPMLTSHVFLSRYDGTSPTTGTDGQDNPRCGPPYPPSLCSGMP